MFPTQNFELLDNNALRIVFVYSSNLKIDLEVPKASGKLANIFFRAGSNGKLDFQLFCWQLLEEIC